jgi:outer membrane biosynthesis protein TonB
MGPPLRALETCVDDLQAHWGLDPLEQRQLTRPPIPKPATIRRIQRRYPSDLALQGVSAFVPVRLLVDAEGRPTQCVVQVESVDEEFKRAVCAGMARGFEPALDKDGQPVPALYTTSVTFLME